MNILLAKNGLRFQDEWTETKSLLTLFPEPVLMKFSTIGTFLLLLLLFCPGGLRGQDTDLGGLPPLPDLDMGDPQRKLSWSEKRELSKKQAQARVEANIYERKPEDVGMATLGQRVSASATRNKQKLKC